MAESATLDAVERPHVIALSGEEMHIVLRALLVDAAQGDGYSWTSESNDLYERLWVIVKEQSADDEHRLEGRALQEIERQRMKRRRPEPFYITLPEEDSDG